MSVSLLGVQHFPQCLAFVARHSFRHLTPRCCCGSISSGWPCAFPNWTSQHQPSKHSTDSCLKTHSLQKVYQNHSWFVFSDLFRRRWYSGPPDRRSASRLLVAGPPISSLGTRNPFSWRRRGFRAAPNKPPVFSGALWSRLQLPKGLSRSQKACHQLQRPLLEVMDSFRCSAEAAPDLAYLASYFLPV